MPFGMLSRVDPRKHVLDGVQIPLGKGQFWGEGHAPTCPTTLWYKLCKNGWTDRDAVWVMDSGGPKEACIRWGPDPPCERAIIRGMEMFDDTLPWAVQNWLNRSICYLGCGFRCAEGSTCSIIFAKWRQCAHTGANWQIRLNRPSAAAIRHYVKLLWPLIIIRPHRSTTYVDAAYCYRPSRLS